jgi:hypothetical protein
MTRRVAVWGTGNVGVPAIRTVLANPALELVDVIVHSEEKEGVDAATLAGRSPECGVRATRDVDAVLARRPDALVYAVNQDFRPAESTEEMLRCLRAGVNVVTSGHYGLLHPPSAPRDVKAAFEAACTEGGSTILSSGIDPGFAVDLLPIVLSGVCAGAHEIRIIENFNYATYDVPEAVRAMIGFGAPMERTPMMILPGIPTRIWGGAIRSLADALDVSLDDVVEVTEKHALERDVEVLGRAYARGTLGAFRFEVQGLVGGHPLLVVEHVTRIVDDTAPQWEGASGMGYHAVRISGTPNISLTLESEDEHGDHVGGGNTTAAARITNAIPWVCDAPPGLLAASDLPLIAGRGLVRPPAR